MDVNTRRAQTAALTAEAIAAAAQPDRDGQRAALIHAHLDASRILHGQLRGSWAEDHLAERDIPSGPDVGYAPGSWTMLVDQLRALDHSDQVLVDAGLALVTSRGTLVDRFRDRLMLTVHDAAGQPVAFVGRAPDGAVDGKGEPVPRYLNSPTTLVWDKSRVLYGLGGHDRTLRGGATPVLVEGPLDARAVTAAGAGEYIGLSALGTALTGTHVQALHDVADLTDRAVLFGFDADAAGHDAVIRAAGLTRRVTSHARVLDLPIGADPASEHQAGRLTELLHTTAGHLSVTTVLVDHELAQAPELRSIERRVEAARRCAPIVVSAEPGTWPMHISDLAHRLDLNLATVNTMVIEAASPTSPPPLTLGDELSTPATTPAAGHGAGSDPAATRASSAGRTTPAPTSTSPRHR